jgi:threonine dehydrogenase-like Zn-dependent dehydrogenase
VRRWLGDIPPLVRDDADPLGTDYLATHVPPLEETPRGYEPFRKKQDSCVTVLLTP